MSSNYLGRLLVVDDEVELMNVLVEMLTGQGYAVTGFTSGRQALAALHAETYDVLLADLMMPDMDGIALLREGLNVDPHLIGLIMTGQGTVQTAVEAMKIGAFDYILKPFKLQMLLPTLTRAVEVRRLRLENLQLRDAVAMHDLSQTIALTLDANAILEKVADIALHQCEADEISILLTAPAGDELQVAAVRGEGRTSWLGQRLPMDQGVASWVARSREPIILSGEVDDPRFSPLYPRPDIKSAISVPMLAGNKLIGVLNVNVIRRRPFTSGQIKVLSVLANTAAAALENGALYQTLSQREEYFRALIENSSDGIALIDAEGVFQYLSPAITSILGYAIEELIGQSGLALCHPDDLESAADFLRSAAQSPKQVQLAAYRVRHKNGAWRWVEGTVKNLLADPDVQAIVVNYRDITERMQAEEGLRQSESKYRELIEQASDGMVMSDGGSHLIEVNSSFCAMLGYTREELLQIEVGALIADREQNPPRRQELLEGKTVVNERQFRRKDGALVPVEVSTRKLSSGNFQAIVRDITERKRIEETLRQNAAEIEALYRASAPLIKSENDLADLAEGIARAVTREFALADCGVMLVDEARGELQRIARSGDFQVMADSRLLLDGPGLTVAAARTGQIIYAPDVTAEPDYLAGQSETRSELAIPLRVGGRVIGVLDFQSPDLDAFDTRARRIVATFAERAALALEHTRLLDETRRRAAELEALTVVSNALRVASTRAEMLPVILDQLLNLLKADGATMAMRDLVTGESVNELARGVWAEVTGSRDPAGTGITARVIAEGWPYTNDDVRTDRHWYWPEGVADPQVKAVAAAPLMTQGHAIGVLWVGRERPFSEDEVRLLTAIANMAANAIQRATFHEQTQRRLEHLQALRTIDEAIATSLDLQITLDVLLSQVTAQLRVDAADVLLLDPQTHILFYAAGRGFRTDGITHSRLRLGEGYAGQAALERRLISVPDLSRAAPLARAALLVGENFAAYFGVPLIVKGQIKGVLDVFHRAPLTPDSEWLNLLETLARQAAIAIDNAGLFEGLQRSNLELILAYDATIEGWSRALDLRDKETEGHTLRVTEMTLRLAQAVGLSQAELIHVRRGTLLHDIGKMGVPDNILLKAGPLSEEEWVLMQKHPTYAYELLLPITFLHPALDIPYCHHEKWDGTGYPRGLKSEQIPLAARLFAVVDVWDALRSDRPYRQGWPEEKIRNHVRAGAETHFDPKVAEVFLKIMNGK